MNAVTMGVQVDWMARRGTVRIPTGEGFSIPPLPKTYRGGSIFHPPLLKTYNRGWVSIVNESLGSVQKGVGTRCVWKRTVGGVVVNCFVFQDISVSQMKMYI